MEVTLCLVLLTPSEAFSSREGAIHQSDPGQTKATHFHGADLQKKKKKEPLFPEPPSGPFGVAPSLSSQHPHHSFSLPLPCQTWETAWWLQPVESSFTCWYSLGSWCRINWRHKIEKHSEILTESKSSRRW